MKRSFFSTAPRWLVLVIGVAAIVVGAVLTLKPFGSLDALTVFIGASLILAGLGEYLSDDEETTRGVSRIVGVILIVTGLVALVLRDQTIRFVAIVVGIGLLVGGLSRLWSVARGRSDDRYLEAVGGLAGVVLGVLALSWRDATILVVAVLVGPVAVIFGVGQVLRSIRGVSKGTPARRQGEGRRSGLGRVVQILRVTGSLILAVILVGVSALLHNGSPSVSAFYKAPDDLPETPGQLVRSEAFDRGLPTNSRAEKMLFTTTAFDGSIEVASGIVIIPTAATTGPRPVLLWAHGTTGIAESCAPSILDDPLGAGAMPAQQQVIDNGWVLVAPDYIGLGTRGPHPYLIGAPTAWSSIDAVRAARQLDGLSLSEQTVVWGHSQGGGAALWVGIEARTYAQDVPLLGVASMAPASDLLSLAPVMQSSRVGMLFAAFIVDAYSKIYPDVRFDDYVRSSARAVLESVVTRCLSEPAMLLSIGAVLSGENLYSQEATSGPLATRLAENAPNAPSGVPTFLGQGLSDDLILPDVQEAFVNGLCSAGQVVEYHTYAGRDHLSVVADNSPMISDLLAWTTARFAGVPGASACSTTEK